jgi:HemX protein
LYLFRHYSLKAKRVGGAYALLPSLRELELIGLRLHLAGVLLLGAALAVGAVWWLRAPGSVLPAKLLATTGVFLAYVLALVARRLERLIGRRQALLCLALFGAALLSLAPVDSSRPRPAGPSLESPAR